MAKRKTKDVLEDIHVELAADLLKRIKAGTATAADLSVARQFLKDNGIEGNARNHKPLRELAGTVPFKADEEDTGT